MEAVNLAPATIAAIAVIICILVAILLIVWEVYLYQAIQTQWVSVQRCRWTGFWGSLLCLLIWVCYIIEVIIFILLIFAIPLFILANIVALMPA